MSRVRASSTWFTRLRRCNKSCQKGSPIVPPGGQFPTSAASNSTPLALRYTSIYRPYVTEDATSDAGFIVDTVVTHTQDRGAKPIALESAVKSMAVSISI